MKKVILLPIFIIGLAHSVIGQTYQSVFGDSCSSWYIFTTTDDNLAGGTDVRHASAGDTVIVDGKTYFFLRHSNEESHYELPVYNNEPQLLREDENHSKLFFKENHPGISAPEILIMDLNLKTGDTLDTRGWSELVFSGLTASIPRITIDSCYHVDGRKILRTDYSNTYYGERKDTLFFIEGVGPSFGPYYPRQNYLNSLSCYYKDNVCLYHGKDYYIHHNNCVYGWPADITEFEDDGINCTIYPNPTSDQCSLRVPDGYSYTIEIRNALGKTIILDKFDGCNYAINLDNYPTGIYFVIVKNSFGFSCKKIIKK